MNRKYLIAYEKVYLLSDLDYLYNSCDDYNVNGINAVSRS